MTSLTTTDIVSKIHIAVRLAISHISQYVLFCTIYHTATERKRKWAEQTRRNLELLHGIGVVWGDGKPENVLIHSETDDCYLVDFGGSWTDGWVDAELKETEAGDEQALTRILDFLGVRIADKV
ncbi:hypothetical protein LOCC1_G008107 [Lachnellula occidentalis]|uniref:Protein kinase domain-containing protein n=1 Tax=Lachnellula occidentalis TaxID=215460 RepID=A0A8H8UA31_9HELO|nr:hypothetical protein LOCC1_G008107 [Lachnellula occidentalis]